MDSDSGRTRIPYHDHTDNGICLDVVRGSLRGVIGRISRIGRIGRKFAGAIGRSDGRAAAIRRHPGQAETTIGRRDDIGHWTANAAIGRPCRPLDDRVQFILNLIKIQYFLHYLGSLLH